jgi:ABC-2 type transport system ATP-binding protein
VSRRDFWDQIHRIAGEGTTVLVTTHYMDEAERCHRLAFIFRGQTIGVGTPEEIVDGRGLEVVEVEAERTIAAADALRGLPYVEEVAHFGRILRVGFRGEPEPERVVRETLAAERIPVRRIAMGRPSVEDVFVSMVREDEASRDRNAA